MRTRPAARIIAADGSVPCASSPYGGSGWRYLPSQVNFSQVLYDRVRHGASAALQFESSDRRWLATAQYMDSQYDNAWGERSSNISFFSLWAAPSYSPQSNAVIGPADGTPAFTFGPDGMLRIRRTDAAHGRLARWQHGRESRVWLGGARTAFRQLLRLSGSPSTCSTQRQGVYVGNEARNFDHAEGTRDVSFNLRWNATDRLRATFDIQRIDAETDNYDILVGESHDGECEVFDQQRRHAAHRAAARVQRQLRAGLSGESSQLLHSVRPGSFRGQRSSRDGAARRSGISRSGSTGSIH